MIAPRRFHPTFARFETFALALAFVPRVTSHVSSDQHAMGSTASGSCDLATGMLIHGGIDARACTTADFASEVRVQSSEQLTTALAASTCGSRIVVAAGTYAGDFTLATKGCAPSKPLIVQGESGATFAGSTVTLNGNRLIVSGLTFERGAIRVNGLENRVTRNVLRDSPKTAISVNGARNLIDHNETDHTDGGAIEITLGKDGSANRENRIERNYIHHQVGDGNGHEGIRVLTDSYHTSATKILYNLMDAIDVPGEGEAISIKSSGLTIRGNTLIDSPQSHFTNRHGSDNLWELNWMENTGGMNLWGDRHVVRYNVLRKSPINLPQGNGNQDSEGCMEVPRLRPTSPDCEGVHPASRHVTVIDNDVQEVVVGNERRKVTWDLSVLPESAQVIRSGKPELGHQRGTRVTPGAPRGAVARKLTVADVGPNGPEMPTH